MKHLLLGTFLVLAMSGQAQLSAPLLAAQDTLFISFDDTGRKFTQHALAKGQTLYGVAKYYGLPLDKLQRFNVGLDYANLSLGQAISIPIPNRSIHRYKTDKTKSLTLIPIIYEVQAGDNLFDIAHRKFNMDVQEFKLANGVTNETLSPGETLRLGWFDIAGINPEDRQGSTPAVVTSAASEKMEKFYSKGETEDKSELFEQGMAEWNNEGANKKDLFALHRSAPIGSVIKVENPMNNRIVYAKVVGRLPENIYEDKVRVVLSKKVGQFLGAVDTRFFVKIRYLRS